MVHPVFKPFISLNFNYKLVQDYNCWKSVSDSFGTSRTKAGVTSTNTDVHSADWLMCIFVIELTPPHVRSQQGQCVRQCRRIMKDTLHISTKGYQFWHIIYNFATSP